MPRIKSTARLEGLSPQMLVAVVEVDRVFGVYGYDAMITSGSDSEHRENSDHYIGNALDYRTHHVHPDHLPSIVRVLKWNLSPLFLVLDEGDHLHVAYIPPAS